MVVRKGELVKFIDLLTNDGETSMVVNYCITFVYNIVVNNATAGVVPLWFCNVVFGPLV